MITPFQNTDASIDQAHINAELGRPIGDDFGRAVKRNEMIVRLATLLLFVCCPSHIAFFVMPVYVNSVKRVFGTGLVTKFVNKFFKRIETKLNSATTIVGISDYIRILTPFLGFNIANIFGRFTSAVSSRWMELSEITTARFSAIRFQMATRDRVGIAAITTTKPMNMSIFSVRNNWSAEQRNYSKAVKFLSDKVNEVWMIGIDGFNRVVSV